jgi:hypothetical protein
VAFGSFASSVVLVLVGLMPSPSLVGLQLVLELLDHLHCLGGAVDGEHLRGLLGRDAPARIALDRNRLDQVLEGLNH